MTMLACLFTERHESIGLTTTDEGGLRWQSDVPGLADEAEMLVPTSAIPPDPSVGNPIAWAIKKLAWFKPGTHCVLADHFDPPEFADAHPGSSRPRGGDGTPTADLTESYRVPTVAEINRAARETDREPTHAQREAGTYRKGKIRIHGLLITIENAKGSFRRGVSHNGKPWESEVIWPYGYISQVHGETAGKIAGDDEHLDCFLGPVPESEIIFVIDQSKPDGSHDEFKVMIAWTNAAEAKAAYLSHYHPSWDGLKSITPMTMDYFKEWVKRGAQRQEIPVAESYEAEPALKGDMEVIHGNKQESKMVFLILEE